MQTRLNPYLGFRDDAREAMSFYQRVFGGELALSTFGEFEASNDPVEKNKIMHAMLTTPNGMVLMGADTPTTVPFNKGDNFSVSLSGDNEVELTEYYEKLIEDGTVIEPLAKAPWGDSFGMLRDKFGITWLVNIATDRAAAGTPETAPTTGNPTDGGNAPDNSSAPNPAAL